MVRNDQSVKILYWIIAILVGVIILQRHFGNKPESVASEPEVIIRTKTDTVWIAKRDTVYSKPRQSAPPKMDTTWRDTLRFKDSSYQYLMDRYIALGDKHYAEHTYEEKIAIDTFGFATIKDTVKANEITGRSFSYDIKWPQINTTTTITVKEPYKPKRQMYLGGSLWGTPQAPVNGITGGLLYKDRKDRMFSANAGIINTQFQFGISSYWKIKL